MVSSEDIPYIQWNDVTKARVQGVETSFKLGFFDGGLLYSLGYTYVYPEDLTTHDLLKYRPRHLLYTSATARIGPFTAGADFSFGGIPCTATVNVNNAFQHNYVELIGNIMPPRTFVLTFEAHP